MLSALVERSLSTGPTAGAYGLHELLRQFANRAAGAAGDVRNDRARPCRPLRRVPGRHGTYRLADIPRHAGLAEVDPETANLRAAWQELPRRARINAVAGL